MHKFGWSVSWPGRWYFWIGVLEDWRGPLGNGEHLFARSPIQMNWIIWSASCWPFVASWELWMVCSTIILWSSLLSCPRSRASSLYPPPPPPPPLHPPKCIPPPTISSIFICSFPSSIEPRLSDGVWYNVGWRSQQTLNKECKHFLSCLHISDYSVSFFKTWNHSTNI